MYKYEYKLYMIKANEHFYKEIAEYMIQRWDRLRKRRAVRGHRGSDTFWPNASNQSCLFTIFSSYVLDKYFHCYQVIIAAQVFYLCWTCLLFVEPQTLVMSTKCCQIFLVVVRCNQQQQSSLCKNNTIKNSFESFQSVNNIHALLIEQ